MSQKKINIAIIGLGFGAEFIPIYQKHPLANMYAICQRSPEKLQKDYVPQMQEVLYSTKLLNPGESFILQFTAPNKPGDYPFVCTFPGHWRIMNGIMRVTK